MSTFWHKAFRHPLFLCFLICSPALFVSLSNRVLWSWDPAWYAQGALEGVNVLVDRPSEYLTYLLHLFGIKAPLIAWVSQVWVPLARVFERPELLTLTSFISLFLSCWFLVRATGSILPGLFLVTFNLAFHLTHEFMVEPLQMFSVCWVIAICLQRKAMSWGSLLLETMLAGLLGLGAKASTPLYVLLWLVPIGFELALREKWRFVRADFKIWMVIPGALGALTIGWYANNFGTLLDFIRTVSSGEVAKLYGTTGSFLQKSDFWLNHFIANTVGGRFRDASLTIFWVSILYLIYIVWRKRKFPDGSLVTLATPILQILLVLAVFCFQTNEETRYLLPMFPSVAILAFELVQNHRVFTVTAVAISLFRLGELTLASYDFIGNRTGSVWSASVRQEQHLIDRTNRLLEVVCKSEQPRGCVGVDRPELNFNTLNYRVSFYLEYWRRNCNFGTLGHAPQNLEKAWNYAMAVEPSFFITLSDVELMHTHDAFNRLAYPFAARVQNDPAWKLIVSFDGWRVFGRIPLSKSGE